MLDQTPSELFHFAGFTLDLRKGTLLKGTETVFVRPKAYVLLTHLACNAGRVVSKSELMDAVWPDVTVSEDSLTQCVREIRKALDDESQSIIRTVSRRGYLFAHCCEADVPAQAQPTVAILRFRNAGQPGHDSFVDGFAEDILNALARFRMVSVRARNTSFAIPVEARDDVRAVGERLAAGYLVDGSVLLAGTKLTVTAKLIEATNAVQLWSDRFEAEDAEIFKIQDEIARRIVSRLVARLEDAELLRSARKPAANLAAYELLLRGIAALRGYHAEDNETARLLFEAAIAKDPDCGLAYAYLALTQVIINGFSLAPSGALAEAQNLAAKGINLAPEEARCHRILALVRLYLRQHEPAEHHLRRALELNPYDADTLVQMGYLLTMRGKPLEGLAWMERAIGLNPMHPNWYHCDRAMALYVMGDYEAAAAAFERLPLLGPWTRCRVASCYAQLGKTDEARRHMAKAFEVDPLFSPMDYARRGVPLERPGDIKQITEDVALVLSLCAPELTRT
jgi:TolB-like protein/Flp pilus assembly protein TadD